MRPFSYKSWVVATYCRGMDRIWQWAWDRYATRYSWAICAIASVAILPFYLLLSFVVVAFEGSGHYVEAAAVTAVATLVLMFVSVRPGWGPARRVQQWAAGRDVDSARALAATYTWGRGAAVRTVSANAVGVALR
jgi:adenylate cyclase